MKIVTFNCNYLVAHLLQLQQQFLSLIYVQMDKVNRVDSYQSELKNQVLFTFQFKCILKSSFFIIYQTFFQHMGSQNSCCYPNATSSSINIHDLSNLVHPINRKASHDTEGGQQFKHLSHKSSTRDIQGHSDRGQNVKLCDFDIVKKVGTGAYGMVVAGYHKRSKGQSNRKMYAIKQMKKEQIRKYQLAQNILLQKDIMSRPKSPFITQLCYAFKNNDSYFLAMEYAQKGDIFNLIHPKNKNKKYQKFLEEDCIRFIMGCVIMGLEYLHSKNIIYQDMKPENLLVFSDGYVKITDFGLSEKINSDVQKQMHVGTPEFFAPEMLFGKKYNKSIDMWALGVLAFQLANGCLPFPYDDIQSPEEYVKLIKKGPQGWNWKNNKVSSSLRDMIGQLLKYESSQRLGAKGWKQIKEHQFFKSVKFNWKSLEGKTMKSPLLELLPSENKGINSFGKAILEQNLKGHDITLTDDEESLNDWSINLQTL